MTKYVARFWSPEWGEEVERHIVDPDFAALRRDPYYICADELTPDNSCYGRMVQLHRWDESGFVCVLCGKVR